jgi:hypothetical protein
MNWRDNPATEKQLSYLNFFGFTPDHPLTKGEAADLIDQFSKDPERQKIRDRNYELIRAFTLREYYEQAKQALEKAEKEDIEDAEMSVQDTRNERLYFWEDAFRMPCNMETGFHEQLFTLYLAQGYRFEMPSLEQIQIVLDALDANSPTWDKEMPEYFFQTLEYNYPELLIKDLDLKEVEIIRNDSLELLENLRQVG